MRVYHGSSIVIEKPNIAYSRSNLDFGKGFYLTSFKEQAERWALRKAVREEGKAIVGEYDLNDDLSAYRLLNFEDDDSEWVEFVCSCRRGGTAYQEYDIIMGSVANDKVKRQLICTTRTYGILKQPCRL